MSATWFAPLIGVLGAITGAIVAALASRLVSRPKPVVVVDQISIQSIGTTSPHNDAPVTKDKGLEAACDEAPFVAPEFPKNQSTEEGVYIDALKQVLEQIDEILEHRLHMSSEVAGSLHEYLSNEEHRRFDECWAQNQDTIWELLEVGHYRGDCRIPKDVLSENATGENEPSKDELIEVVPSKDLGDEDDNRRRTLRLHPEFLDYWVYVQGINRPIGFIFSHRERSRKDAKRFARRSAYAFVHRHPSALRCLVRFLNDCERLYTPVLTQLKEQVESELERYRRLVITGQATNAGRSPYSILNTARMFVLTKALPYEENGTPSRYPENMEIDMRLIDTHQRIDNHKQVDLPLSVGSGEVSRFTAVSDDYTALMKHPKVLVNTLTGSDTKFHLGVWTTLSTKQKSTVYYTKDQPFRDWKTKLNIPRKSSRLRALLGLPR